MNWHLKSLHGSQEYTVTEKDFIIGRDANVDMCCKNYAISRKHAAMKVEDDVLKVIDYNSLNGTFINNEKIKSNIFYTLKENDAISFGVFVNDGAVNEPEHNPPKHLYYFRISKLPSDMQAQVEIPSEINRISDIESVVKVCDMAKKESIDKKETNLTNDKNNCEDIIVISGKTKSPVQKVVEIPSKINDRISDIESVVKDSDIVKKENIDKNKCEDIIVISGETTSLKQNEVEIIDVTENSKNVPVKIKTEEKMNDEEVVTILDSDDENDDDFMASQLFTTNISDNFQYSMYNEIKKELDVCDNDLENQEDLIVFPDISKIKEELDKFDRLDQLVVFPPIDLDESMGDLQALLEEPNYDATDYKNCNENQEKSKAYLEVKKEVESSDEEIISVDQTSPTKKLKKDHKKSICKSSSFKGNLMTSEVAIVYFNNGIEGENISPKNDEDEQLFIDDSVESIENVVCTKKRSTNEHKSKSETLTSLKRKSNHKESTESHNHKMNKTSMKSHKDLKKAQQEAVNENKISTHSNLNRPTENGTKNKSKRGPIIIEASPKIKHKRQHSVSAERSRQSSPHTRSPIKKPKLLDKSNLLDKPKLLDKPSKGFESVSKDKTQIKEDRKQKLKGIALKDKEEAKNNTVVNLGHAKKDPREKSKISASCNSNPSTSSSSSSIETFKIPPKLKFDTIEIPTRKPSVVNSISSRNVETRQAQNLPEFSWNSKKNIPENIIGKHKIFSSKSNLFEDLVEEVIKVINWKYVWIEEQKKEGSFLLPIANSAVRMCNTFTTFKDYYKVVQPLVLLDYWYYICTEFESDDFTREQAKISTFMGVTSNIQVTKTHTELTCYSYLSKQKAKNRWFQDKHFVFLHIQYGQKREWVKIFGVISRTFTDQLSKTGEKIDERLIDKRHNFEPPDTKLTSIIIVPTLRKKYLSNSKFFGRYFTSFPQVIRKLRCIKYMENSPLMKSILQPTIDDYRIPGGFNNQIIDCGFPLNESQKLAVIEGSNLYFYKKSGIYLIEGPPGTGKSQVILNMLINIIKVNNKAQILLLAPSNGAVDAIFSKYLSHYRQKFYLKIVRFGVQQAIAKTVSDHSVEELAKFNVRRDFFKEHDSARADYEVLKKDIASLKEKLEASPGDHNLLGVLEKKNFEYKNFLIEYMTPHIYYKKLDHMRRHILVSAHIICTTIGSCHNLLKQMPFDRFHFCIIDEATQCSEVETLIAPALGINKIVLVGDPKQLPATTNHMNAKNLRCGQSLFERLKYSLSKLEDNPIRLLDVQYRMHPSISSFPNKHFYDGCIKDAVGNDKCFEYLKPYMIFSEDYRNGSTYENVVEVEQITLILTAILKLIAPKSRISIGIITFYSNQRNKILENITKNLNIGQNISLTCNTIDSFQGQEKDIILFSCVRNTCNLFLSDQNRINVALTRAKYGLFILGPMSLFKTDDIYKKLKQDAVNRGLFHELPSGKRSANDFKLYLQR